MIISTHLKTQPDALASHNRERANAAADVDKNQGVACSEFRRDHKNWYDRRNSYPHGVGDETLIEGNKNGFRMKSSDVN